MSPGPGVPPTPHTFSASPNSPSQLEEFHAQRCSGCGEGEQGYVKVRPGRQRRGARQDLNLLPVDVQVGEGTAEFPWGRSQKPPAKRLPVAPPAPGQGATPPSSPCPTAPVPPRLVDLSAGQPPPPAHPPSCLLRLASVVAGPACSPGSLPPGLMALTEGGRPPSCQSGGAPRSPSWLERGGWASAGAGLSGPSQR